MARSNGCRARRSRSANAARPKSLLGPTPVDLSRSSSTIPARRRRPSAASAPSTIGHLTPPLIAAGSHGAALELEGLFDEFAEAQALDPRRARAIADAHPRARARDGLLSGMRRRRQPPEEALVALDAWLCDLKDMRIGDGLHVFGRSPESADGFAAGSISTRRRARRWASASPPAARPKSPGCCARSAAASSPPGRRARRRAGGSTCCRPGAISTPSIRARCRPAPPGRSAGARPRRCCARYAQDHGDWPRRIVLDLWGSATMRTGGDDLAQAFALLGCRPLWDDASNRVSGFEILPLAMLGRPRVDVTLRISGLFRDVFPARSRCFAARFAPSPRSRRARTTIRSPALRRRGLRAFSARRRAPMASASARASREATGRSARELAEAYLAATSHAYDGEGEAREAAAAFRARVAGADAFVHAQDLPGQDALDADAFAEHEGGFAAAAAEARRQARRSIISTRPRPARPRSAASARRSPARCAAAPPIRAGSPARCGTAIAARRRSPRRSIISSPSPR